MPRSRSVALGPELRRRRFGAPGPTAGEVGESALVETIVALATQAAAGATDTVSVPGDDAARWTPPAGTEVAVSVDAAVEEVDFRRSWITPYQLGRRALAAALGDLAATGAVPAWCLVTVCAPGHTVAADLWAICLGVVEAGAAVGCHLAGGDVGATSGPLVLDLVVGGWVEAGRALRRDAGSVGDLLYVTGTLGRAAAGLRLLEGTELEAPEAQRRTWIAAQVEPPVRLAEGRRLLHAGVRCAGDLSDGLLVDATRTAAASGCAAELWCDHLPVDPELRTALKDDWLQAAVGGGEDFELLCAMSTTLAAQVLSQWPAELAPLSLVGRLVAGRGARLLDTDGGVEVGSVPVHSRHFT